MFSSVSAETEIVIIDDSLTNLILLSSCLKSFGLNKVRIFSDSAEGLEWLMNNQWNLALLDLSMPSPDGFEVLDCLSQRNRAEYPIIIVTALNDPESRRKGLERGANDFISKPIDLPEVLLRVRSCLELAEASRVLRNANAELERKVEERTAQLEDSYKAIINSLTRAASYRDDDTGEHIQRIGESAAILAKAIDMPTAWCDLIRMAAPMHDVGKIGIEDAILQKPGPLTDEERKSMQRHARIGYDILLDPNRSAVTDMAAEIALAHHERWDGQGYPNGLKGDAIPLSARIVAICDVYDALRMPRPYKKPWSKEDAQHYIRDQEGTHFDPHLVKVFCTLFDSIEALRDLKS